MLVLGQEVGLLAGIEPRLALDALLQQLLALRAEAALQLDHEGQRLGGENGFEARLECAGDLYARHLRPTRHGAFSLCYVCVDGPINPPTEDRKSTRMNSSH